MKLFALFLSAAVSAFAQFAPRSPANLVFNVRYSDGSQTSGFFSADGNVYSSKDVGVPLALEGSYTYQKTGDNSARLIETIGPQIITFNATFTGTDRGFFTATSNDGLADFGTFFYSIASAPSPLVNIATRGTVAAGGNLQPGFVVGGAVSRRVLLRAAGPALAAFGVAAPMADPKIAVLKNGAQIAANDNWLASDAATMAGVGAFAFAAGSRDAALVLTLEPGAYTAIIESATAGGSGEVVAEVYFID